MSETTRIELNGQAKGKAKAKSRPARGGRRAMVPRPPRKVALALTFALGVGIPLLSLAVSNIAGTLAQHEHFYLAGAGLGLCSSVLAVSLSHLAWAISDITRSGLKASWALAVSVDLSIVLCELTAVFATDSELHILTTTLMGCVCVASMMLNCWAFTRHS